MCSNQKPRIVYILPSYNPAAGSHFFHLYELLERAAGHLDIFLIVEKAKSPPANLPFNFYIQKFSFAPLRIAELLFILARERLRGRKYFYTHYSFFGAVFSWLVTHLAGGAAYYWNCGMPWLYRRGFFEESVFRFILRHLILVTGTPAVAREYEERYGLKEKHARIMPNWINLRRFQKAAGRQELRVRLGLPQDSKVILFVHRLSRRKGAHLILPAAKIVAERQKNVIFVIVGAGPEFNNLKLEIRNWKLEDNVRFVGEVPNKEIHDYFTAADMFFMPSEEEGFPHVLLEAMAAGVPYVASDVGGVKEITPPELQEYIVPRGDVEMYAKNIINILAMSDDARGRLGEAEKKWVEKYDINEVLPKFTGLFEKP